MTYNNSLILFESWTAEDSCLSVRGERVDFSPSPSEGILCVAHLPLIYSENDFDNLVQMCGPVARCFLMRSCKSGASKGYGFVEYTSKTSALQARDLLDSKEIGSCRLRCDWLDPNRVTYKSLQSRCLFVDHLPPEFRDVDELRHVFSVIVKPIYCQVVLKNSCPTGIGLVEFDCAEFAEETQSRLNGFSLEKRKMRVSFCMPGIHAMTICNKLVDDPNVTTILHNLQCSLLAGQLQNAGKGASMGLLATPSPPLPPAPVPHLSSSNNNNNNNNSAQVQAAVMLLLAAQAQQNGQRQNSLLATPQTMRGINNNNNNNNENNCSNTHHRTSRRPLLPDPPHPQRKGLLPTPAPESHKRNWDTDCSTGCYWKSPLLGERPRNYYETSSNKTPLLGERPPPPSSLSPTSSVSSLASDLTDTSNSTSPSKDSNLSHLDILGNTNPLMNFLLQATRQNHNLGRATPSLLGKPRSTEGANDVPKRPSLLGDFPGALQLLLPVGQSKRKLYDGAATATGLNSQEIGGEYKRLRK
uniref:RRM domain-containing protein n=1 Tax=Strigamia maritima TaxID=126957 RepID=T1INE5_STRMM